MQVIYERCAGLTIRKKMVEVCVLITQSDGTVEKLIQTFSTMTTDLLALEEWLGSLSIEHIGMKSAGVHWYLVYYMLSAGRHILLIQPQHLKALLEHKMDMSGCECLAELLRHDRLKASYVSSQPANELHDLLRYRTMLITEQAQEVNRLRGILKGTTRKLEWTVLEGTVLDVLDKSGWLMSEAIISEQGDARVLTKSAQEHLRSVISDLLPTLDGQVQQHQQILLQRILAHMEFCEESLAAVQKEVERHLALFEELVISLQSIPGMHLMAAVTILSEIGTDMSRFPTPKHLTTWAGVYSGEKQNGSKQLSNAATSSNLYVQAILNEIANSIANSEEPNYLTALYQRAVHWRGKRRAIMTVAYKILVLAYYVVRDKKMYEDGVSYFNKRDPTRNGQYRIHQLERLRYTEPLVHSEATRVTRPLFSSAETRSNPWGLFFIWAWISLTSFGGGASSLLLIEREFTEKRDWVTLEEFSHFWNLCTITPGTSQIALSILIGRKLAGIPGVIASMFGLLLPSAIVTYLLAAGFQRMESVPAMQAIWRGIIPATSGLMFLVALRFAIPLITRGRKEGWPTLSISIVMILACVIAILFFKTSTIVVLLAASLAGILFFTTMPSRLRE